ncbi:MAG: DUF1292 domain-containing protein [Clostridium sp.]
MDNEKDLQVTDEELQEVNNAVILLTDEDGKDTAFEFLDLIEFEGEEYVVLSPMYDDEEEVDEDEGHVVILKLTEENEEEGEVYSSFDNPRIEEEVYNIFKEKWQDKYNFVD